MNDRVFRLLDRHQRVDARIRAEIARKAPDSFRLLRLALLKRAVKNRLNQLFGGPLTLGTA
ncbi:hypothetical protein BH10PSE13_BH10PSE13_20850 [soil metagenome]